MNLPDNGPKIHGVAVSELIDIFPYDMGQDRYRHDPLVERCFFLLLGVKLPAMLGLATEVKRQLFRRNA